MRKLAFAPRSLWRSGVAVTVILAIIALVNPFYSLYPVARSAQAVEGYGPNLTVRYHATKSGSGGAWGDSTAATIGDTVEFGIEVHNTNVPSHAKHLTVKVDLPATPAAGSITSTAQATTPSTTTVDGAKTNVTDSTQIIGLPANALLQYESGSMRVTADMNGDDVKEFDNYVWPDDNIITTGVDLGTLAGGNPAIIQMSFKARVVEAGAPSLTVKHLSANPKRPADGWSDDTKANPGDPLQFYVEIHNPNVPSVANNLTVRVDLPNGEGNSLTSLVTADAANAAAVVDSTKVKFDDKAKWHVRAKSTRITWDSNGDGVLDYREYLWPNDKLFSSEGITLGELWGCNPYIIQISFWVDTEAAPSPPSEPSLSIDKKVIFNGAEHDSVGRETHLYDPNEEVEYKLVVKNSGEQDATGVKVVDSLPAYIRTPDGADRKEFTIGALAAGKEWVTTYFAKVAADIPQNDRTQENRAVVTADGGLQDEDTAFIWINGPEILAAEAEAAVAEAEELPVTGPALPVAAGLAGMLPVGWFLRRRLL